MPDGDGRASGAVQRLVWRPHVRAGGEGRAGWGPAAFADDALRNSELCAKVVDGLLKDTAPPSSRLFIWASLVGCGNETMTEPGSSHGVCVMFSAGDAGPHSGWAMTTSLRRSRWRLWVEEQASWLNTRAEDIDILLANELFECSRATA